MEHPTLGRLVYDAALRWHEGHATVGGVEVALAVSRGALVYAARVAPGLDGHDRAARDGAVAALLAVKNESWREPGEPEVTAVRFREALALESVVVYADGVVELYYADGGLFWGHTVVVRLGPDGRVEEADLAG